MNFAIQNKNSAQNDPNIIVVVFLSRFLNDSFSNLEHKIDLRIILLFRILVISTTRTTIFRF